MLSTLLELVGYAATVAGAALIGVLVAGLMGGFAAGLLVAGPVLVLLGLAAGQPTRRKR